MSRLRSLFPEETQAPRYRKGKRHCKNGRPRIGFDSFKQTLDPLSHMNASSVWPVMIPEQCRDMSGVPMESVRKRAPPSAETGAQILLNG
jgi:hypothetical protein